jgi:O-antigen/teichoic acid export membrane protein
MLYNLFKKFNLDAHMKEIYKGSLVTFILRMIGMMLGYLVMYVISKKYGADGIGVYNLTLSIITIAATISCMGTNVSILRYVGQFNNSNNNFKLGILFWHVIEIVFPISLLLFFVFFYFSEIIAIKFFKNTDYILALKYGAVIIPFLSIQNVSVEFIRGLKKLKISEYLRSVSRPIINIILLLIFSIYIEIIVLPVFTVGIAIAVSTFIALYYILQSQDIYFFKKNIFFEKEFISRKDILSTSLPMFVTILASLIMENISIYIVEYYHSTNDVGIFSISYKIAMLASLPLLVVNTISAPKFSELYWQNKANVLQQTIDFSSKIITSLSLFICVIILFFSSNIFRALGNDFLSGQSIIKILLLSNLVNAITGSVGIFLNMTGNQKILRNIICFSAIICLIINFLFVPKFGLIGAAFSNLVGSLLLNVTSSVFVKVKIGYRTYYSPIPYLKEIYEKYC